VALDKFDCRRGPEGEVGAFTVSALVIR
jgi:hypothetical protein